MKTSKIKKLERRVEKLSAKGNPSEAKIDVQVIVLGCIYNGPFQERPCREKNLPCRECEYYDESSVRPMVEEMERKGFL